MEMIIENLLDEVDKDYQQSSKKSILDYVLSELEERERVGIIEILDLPIEYGKSKYKGIIPDEQWKQNLQSSKKDIAENLILCNPATLSRKIIISNEVNTIHRHDDVVVEI